MAMHSDPRMWHPVGGKTAVPENPQALDWHGLVSRLVAASDARMALAHARNFASGASKGSFDARSARLLETLSLRDRDEAMREYDYPNERGGVNLVDSGRGKSLSTITADTAGIDSAGDRGLK